MGASATPAPLARLPLLTHLPYCSVSLGVAAPAFVGSARVLYQKGSKESFRELGDEAVLERINAG